MKAISTISFWKNAALSLCLCVITIFSSSAQCSAPQSITYDTLVIGSGNDAHTFNITQFDPALGTLAAVNINSIVSVNYGFTLKNTNSSAINFSIAVGRNDNFQSSVLSSPYNNSLLANVGTFTLNPNQTITQALTTVINRYDNTINLTDNILDFIGSAKIGFNYIPKTYTDHSVSPSYTYSASANDTIHFSVTYLYCNGIVLAENLINFSAAKENYETVKLRWASVNEQRSRTYEIEKSADAIHFSTAGSVPSIVNTDNTGNYIYEYQTAFNEKTKLWFRLKITDANGLVKYSSMKMVDMTNDLHSGMFIYPNPSDQFVNIVFNQSKNWEVNIMAANGALLQRNYYSNTNMAHINFNRLLPAGVYFARVVEQQTQKSNMLSFVVK